MQRDRDAAFEVFHKVDFLCAQLLTAMVGRHGRIEVKLHEVLFLRDISTISSEGFTSPDPSEGFGIHTSTGQAFSDSTHLCSLKVFWQFKQLGRSVCAFASDAASQTKRLSNAFAF